MAITAAADDTALAILFDEATDEGVRTKPPVMLGRDRPLDGPSAATAGLLGEPIDFSAAMAVTELHNNGRAATAVNILVLVDSGTSEHYFNDSHPDSGGGCPTTTLWRY